MAALFVDRYGSFSLCNLLQQEQAMADTLSRSNKVLPPSNYKNAPATLTACQVYHL